MFPSTWKLNILLFTFQSSSYCGRCLCSRDSSYFATCHSTASHCTCRTTQSSSHRQPAGQSECPRPCLYQPRWSQSEHAHECSGWAGDGGWGGCGKRLAGLGLHRLSFRGVPEHSLLLFQPESLHPSDEQPASHVPVSVCHFCGY